MDDKSEAALEKAVFAQTRDENGKRHLDCARALALAQQFEVPPAAVGRLCDRTGIKITHCQLGCFT